MGQVAVGDVSTGTVDASLLDVVHTIAAGEALIVLVTLGDDAADKEVLDAIWDFGGIDQLSLGAPIFTFNLTTPPRRIEVWGTVVPVAKTATVRVTIEGANSQKMWVGAVAVSNVNPSVFLTDLDTDSGAAVTAFSVSVTQQPDDLGMVVGINDALEAFTPDNSETELFDGAVVGEYQAWLASLDNGPTMGGSWASADAGGGLGFLINSNTVIQALLANHEALGAVEQTADPNYEAVGMVDKSVIANQEALGRAAQEVILNHESQEQPDPARGLFGSKFFKGDKS